MTIRALAGAAALCLATLESAAAAATPPPRPDCRVDIQELGATLVNHYNALAGGEYLEPIRLRLRNQGDEACAGHVRILNLIGGTQLVGLRGRLDYQIVDETSLSTVIFDPVANQSADVPVIVPPRGTIELRPRLRVPGGQAARSGHYAALLTARFTPAGDGDVDNRVFGVAAQVEPSAQANFVGFASGGPASLDLGELAPGVTGTIGLQIRASTDVDLRISSDHLGHLEHAGGARIPYAMTVGGAAVDLGGGEARLALELPDPVHGRTTPVVVTVGAFAALPAGRYSDVVTFRISAY